MHSIGLTRSSIVAPIVGFLERVGAPVERLLVRAGLPPWALTDPEALIPTSGTARLLSQAARTEGIENLGLLAGQEASIETLGVFGRLIRRKSTLGEALEATVHNHPVFSSNGRMWLALHGDQVALSQAFTNAPDEGWLQASHYILMLMLGIVRLGAGSTWRPAEVHLQTAESAALRDTALLSDAHVAFAQPATAIVFPRALLDQPLRPPRLDLELSRESIDTWEASAPAGDFVGSIVQVVEMLSWEGYPDIHLTADVLGMSVRSLQRHLAAAGFTHESLVGRARFATAATLLEETDAKILDIALDLGYSDHAHFTRAFRRWAGCSPQEFRARYRQLRAT
jgi:AraC-like DNA-binding protein